MTKKELEIENEALKSENDKLKRAIRYQWLTLGFYKTEYNYKTKIFNPLTGKHETPIEEDNGTQAAQACDVVNKLGFTPETMTSYPGPGV